jgi:hypothetical protein
LQKEKAAKRKRFMNLFLSSGAGTAQGNFFVRFRFAREWDSGRMFIAEANADAYLILHRV